MAIGNAPIQDTDDGKAMRPAWATWFSGIRRALGGWSQTLTGALQFDFGNIPSLGEATTTFTLTGARVGDVCIVQPSLYMNGFSYHASCDTDDIITIRCLNTTAFLTTPPDCIHRVIVFRQ
jgi:hypothetical protein